MQRGALEGCALKVFLGYLSWLQPLKSPQNLVTLNMKTMSFRSIENKRNFNYLRLWNTVILQSKHVRNISIVSYKNTF